MIPIIAKYNKSQIHQPGYGYDKRTKNIIPKSIVIHTTNGNKGSSFDAEARYITYSPNISAHYLIGKLGQIATFLDPLKDRAWAVGATNNYIFNNNYSVSIECHFTPGEVWTIPMWTSLSNVTKYLCNLLKIDNENMIVTHREIAIPKGRKVDPSGVSDTEFILWRATVFQTMKNYLKFEVISDKANVRQQPKIDNNIAGVVKKGDIIYSIAIKEDESGNIINGTSKWLHLSKLNDQPSGLGFVHCSTVRIIK